MESTKENTLYLPIKQLYFDAIIKGDKTEEYREVKDTTYKKYLQCDKEGWPSVTEGTPEDFTDDLMAYNNGNFPYVPTRYQYLNIVVGYSKERDTAIVEVKDITFEIAKDKEGNNIRFFWDEKTGVTSSPEGDNTLWNVVYHLGNVVELHRKKQ